MMVWWMWLLLILVLLSLVILIILLLLWTRRRRVTPPEVVQAAEPIAEPIRTVAAPMATAPIVETEGTAQEAIAKVTETVQETAEPVASRTAEAASIEQPLPPDDLKIIEGIGPKISSVLQAAGITTLAKLAATEVTELQRILDEANIRLGDPGTWAEQAGLAAEAKWDELASLQQSLKGGRRV